MYKGKHIVVDQLESDRFLYRDSLTQTRKNKNDLVAFLHEEAARLSSHLDEVGACLARLKAARAPATPTVKKIPFGFGVTNIPVPKLTSAEKTGIEELNAALPEDLEDEERQPTPPPARAKKVKGRR